LSRLSRGLAGLARRAGLGRAGVARAERERRRRLGWRWALDDSLLQRLERVGLAPRRAAHGGLGGEHRSRARAASTDFVDYRPYQAGDDFRQIDWNAYGRLDQLYVRLSEAREQLPLHLLVDCSASMGAGLPDKHDYARQIAAVLGYVGLARFDRVSLTSLGGAGPSAGPWRGKQRFATLLAALDDQRPGGSLSLDDALSGFIAAAASYGGQAILISDMLFQDGYQAALDSLLAAGLQPGIIQVLSPQELSPVVGGDVRLEDLESGETLDVGRSPQAVATYLARLTDWCGDVERFCLARGIRYQRITTDQPLQDVALVSLRRSGIVQ
jgi:uncharacterized protein (DUF58 family)